MSDKPIELVIANLKTVNEACKILGNNVIRDLFMLLSFLTLSVIPSLKLTDKGLLDIEKFHSQTCGYNIHSLLRMLFRFFIHSGETDNELQTMCDPQHNATVHAY